MKKNASVIGLICMIVFISFGCSNHKVSIESLLDEMTDRYDLSYYPQVKYTLKQRSSYNRETVALNEPGWWANADMSYFERVEMNNGRREFILFDEEGPGAIVRWWMTFWRAENGILRIYLDGDSIPEMEGSPFELISGQMLGEVPFSVSVPDEAPMNERGHNLYVPIPFSKHCKVSYECDSLIEKDNHFWPDVFYNICFRKYFPDTEVKTFSMDELKSLESKFSKAGNLLLSDLKGENTKSFEKTLAPGDSLSMEFEDQNKAISYLALNLDAANKEQALRSVVVSMSFDDNHTVWVPVGEFFGTGYKMFKHKTWYNQSETEGGMRSSWIMPYQENCRIQYLNYGDEEVAIKAEVGQSDYDWRDNSMYFGASWHEYHHLKTRNEKDWFFDLNYVHIEGKGMYAGDQITLFNMANTWWGEGDEKIFVDGEEFPSSIGTGSEDYYGYAFGHPEAFSHPFISQPSGAGNFVPGITVNIRHRSLDVIPFESSLSANIEMWHWASTCINYALTSYYYVQEGFTTNIKPDVELVRLPVATSKDNFYHGESENECYSIEEFKN